MTDTEEQKLKKFVKVRNDRWEEYEREKKKILLRAKTIKTYTIEIEALVERLGL